MLAVHTGPPWPRTSYESKSMRVMYALEVGRIREIVNPLPLDRVASRAPLRARGGRLSRRSRARRRPATFFRAR